MNMNKLSRENLLDAMEIAEFGTSSKSQRVYTKNRLMLRLLAFHEKLKETGSINLSSVAIRGWFDTEHQRHPTRYTTFIFLSNYFKNVSPKLLTDEQKEYYYLVRDFLAPYNHSSVNIPTPSLHFGREEAALTRLGASVGTYQIIRPTNETNKSKNSNIYAKYTLELLKIEVDKGSNNIYMYSSNSPMSEFVYIGHIIMSRRRAYATMIRHSDLGRDPAVRMISFYLEHSEFRNSPVTSFSGILIRGVEGSRSRPRTVSTPFIAVRIADIDSKEFTTTEFERSNENLWSMHNYVSARLGTVSERDGDLFLYCDQIFAQSINEIRNGLNISTISIELLEEKLSTGNEKYSISDAYKEIIDKSIF